MCKYLRVRTEQHKKRANEQRVIRSKRLSVFVVYIQSSNCSIVHAFFIFNALSIHTILEFISIGTFMDVFRKSIFFKAIERVFIPRNNLLEFNFQSFANKMNTKLRTRLWFNPLSLWVFVKSFIIILIVYFMAPPKRAHHKKIST